MTPVLIIITSDFVICTDSDTPEGAWCLASRSSNLPGVMPQQVPNVFQLGILTSQKPQLGQSLFASRRATISGF